MRTLIRSQLCAFAATMVDWTTTFVLVESVLLGPGAASVVGNVIGGGVNFLLNRHWTFEAAKRPALGQAVRYLLVWAGYIGLGYAAIIIGTEWMHIHYMVVKVVSSILLGIGYNFMMQRHFVFK